jgi:hypothetical protein
LGGIDTDFESLEKVAFLEGFYQHVVVVRYLCTLECWERWNPVSRSHVGTDNAGDFLNRVCPGLYLVFEVAGIGFRGHVGAVAIHIELPAMVDTDEAAFLVTTKGKGSAAMWAASMTPTLLSVSRNAMRSSLRSLKRIGVPSCFLISLALNAEIQNRRIISPSGVPESVRVMRLFSSDVSMLSLGCNHEMLPVTLCRLHAIV